MSGNATCRSWEAGARPRQCTPESANRQQREGPEALAGYVGISVNAPVDSKPSWLGAGDTLVHKHFNFNPTILGASFRGFV